MTRKQDSTMEKINELYKIRAFLKTKLELQTETYARTQQSIHRLAMTGTLDELIINQNEIDKLLEEAQ